MLLISKTITSQIITNLLLSILKSDTNQQSKKEGKKRLFLNVGVRGQGYSLPRRKCSGSQPSLISDPTARRSQTQIQL